MQSWEETHTDQLPGAGTGRRQPGPEGSGPCALGTKAAWGACPVRLRAAADVSSIQTESKAQSSLADPLHTASNPLSSEIWEDSLFLGWRLLLFLSRA